MTGDREDMQVSSLKVVNASGKIVHDLLVIPWPGTCPLPQLTLQPFATAHRGKIIVFFSSEEHGLVKGLAGLWDQQKEK